jgi:hypothetical protein
VDVHLLRDDQLGADAVGRRGENRAAVLADVQPEQAGEAADVAHDLRSGGPVQLGPQQLHRLLAGVDGDPGIGVRDGSLPTSAVTRGPRLAIATAAETVTASAGALGHVRHGFSPCFFAGRPASGSDGGFPRRSTASG